MSHFTYNLNTPGTYPVRSENPFHPVRVTDNFDPEKYAKTLPVPEFADLPTPATPVIALSYFLARHPFAQITPDNIADRINTGRRYIATRPIPPVRFLASSLLAFRNVANNLNYQTEFSE